MSLLPCDAFEPIFTKFVGLKIGYVQLPGNVGDRLIALGAKSLFDTFDINFLELSDQQVFDNEVPQNVDEIVISGGGNLGRCYYDCYQLRQASLNCGLPVTILPQSFASFDEDLSAFKFVYLRETASHAFAPSYQLMPDLALFAPDTNTIQASIFEKGVFLREDIESVFSDYSLSIVDPVRNNYQPDDYIEFASRFAHIITDRLHFAIAGLIAKRQVTLLPNSTGKNKAMFDTWLEKLGCQWLENLTSINYDKSKIIDEHWQIITPVPKYSLPWHTSYQRISPIPADADKNTESVFSLCDGERTISDIAHEIAKEQSLTVNEVAENVAATIDKLYLNRKLRPLTAKELHLQVLPDYESQGWTYKRALVRRNRQRATELWFSVPSVQSDFLSKNDDCFVIAMLMQAMFDKVPLRLIGGAVSLGLIENLNHFQDHWQKWRPELNKIKIYADVELNNSKPVKQQLVLGFSGGLDSSHALYQHNVSDSLDLTPVSAALMVQGFDIPLSDTTGFEKALHRAKRITDDVSIPLLKMHTNFRGVVKDHWQDPHGAALVAAMTVISAEYSVGVIASTMNKNIDHVWGSNPITDPMLGSNSFNIEHCGYEADRLDKFKDLSEWDAAINNLRVCWQGAERGENCGRCQKCVMTQLSLQCLELPLNCFSNPLNSDQLNGHIPRQFSGTLDSYDLRVMANYLKDNEINRGDSSFVWADYLINLFSD